jgi:hypothetical protein
LSSKKKKILPPRHKRMKREGRLQAAPKWIAAYNGKSLIKGYCKHFNVNVGCALEELRTLGVKLDDKLVANARRGEMDKLQQRKAAKAKRKEKRELKLAAGVGSNHDFAAIIGYTSWGFPYGITWEEYNMQLEEEQIRELLGTHHFQEIPPSPVPACSIQPPGDADVPPPELLILP